MKPIPSVYCGRCGEFIGNVGNLDECPNCGYEFFVTEVVEMDDEEDE